MAAEVAWIDIGALIPNIIYPKNYQSKDFRDIGKIEIGRAHV